MSALSLDCIVNISALLLESRDARTFLALMQTCKAVRTALYRSSLLWRRVYVQRFVSEADKSRDVQCSGREQFVARAAKSVAGRARRLNALGIKYVLALVLALAQSNAFVSREC